MKRSTLILLVYLLMADKNFAQKLWDGGGGDNRWDNAANWFPDGIPDSAANVTLNNQWVSGNYQVVLPGRKVHLSNFKVVPDTTAASGLVRSIEIVLPASNTIEYTFQVFGKMQLYKGAIFRHNGGHAGNQFYCTDGWVFPGARWVHGSSGLNTYLANMQIEGGILEFNVQAPTYRANPAARGSIYHLIFSGIAAAARGWSIIYTVDRYNVSVIGSLHVRTNTTLRFMENSILWLTGARLIVDGTIDWSHVSNTNATMYYNNGPYYDWYYNYYYGIIRDGYNTLEGAGSILMNNRFAMILLARAKLRLLRSLHLPNPINLFTQEGFSILETGDRFISGEGIFSMHPHSLLSIGSQDGIWRTASLGNVRTRLRQYGDSSTFEYNSSGVQHTGDGLPAGLNGLIVNKPSGDLHLTQGVFVRDSLKLIKGKINTNSTALLTWSGKNNAFGNITNNYGNTYGWEQSFVNGPMTITLNDAGYLRVFPVGKGSVFAPFILVKRFAGANSYTAEYFPSAPTVTAVTSPLHHISRIEHWSIRSSAISSVTNSVDDTYMYLSWRPSSRIGTTVADRSNLRLGRFVAGVSWHQAMTSGVIGTPSLNAYDFTSFIPSVAFDFSRELFTLASLTVANPMTPLDPFPVVHWQQPAAEDGKLVYTNPVQSVLQVKLTTASAVEIINAAGQVVRRKRTGNSDIALIDMSGFPAGTYYLRVFDKVYPFIKQ